jgi:two-component system LytT family response regulator
MLRTLIIDDEAHNRDTLQKLLAANCPQIIDIAEASGVRTGIRQIKELHPELVFLDINMIDGTGFDLLNTFPARDFKVIIISAFNKDSLKMVTSRKLKYLTKPVNPEELIRAVMEVDLF